MARSVLPVCRAVAEPLDMVLSQPDAGVRYAGLMRVRVLYFGVLRELAGASERDMDLVAGSTVADVVIGCERLLPGTGIWPSIATAVNEEYALRTRELREGDVVALLPPVSGGSR